MWPKITDPIVGTLYRWWGKWQGHTFIQGAELELVIELPRKVDAKPFLDRVRFVVTDFEQFKRDFASQLCDDYLTYKQFDIEAGGFSESDFQKYPVVQSALDIWQVLKPYRLWLGSSVDRYHGNAYLLMHVDWPNPHYFQVFFQLDTSSWKHMHTELVG